MEDEEYDFENDRLCDYPCKYCGETEDVEDDD